MRALQEGCRLAARALSLRSASLAAPASAAAAAEASQVGLPPPAASRRCLPAVFPLPYSAIWLSPAPLLADMDQWHTSAAATTANEQPSGPG